MASTAELVESTGLVQSSISKLRGQLVEKGLLQEVEKVPTGSRGRPSTAVRLGRDWAVAVGVDITSAAARVRGVTPAGRPLFVREAPLPADPPLEEAVARWHRIVHGDLVESGTIDRPVALVVALPGIVSEGRVTVTSRQWLSRSESALWEGVPCDGRVVRAVNDGAGAVTAEVRVAGRDRRSALAIFHGSDGVGGGAFDRGSLISGHGGAAGAFGHTVVEPGGEPCDCGQHGCLERYAAVVAVARAAELDVGSMLLDEVASELARRARAGDPRVLAALARARRYLEHALAQIGPVLCPERVVLAGNLVPLAPWLERPGVREDLRGRPAAVWYPPVRGSRLGNQSVVIGAAEIARLALLDAPLAWDPRPTPSGRPSPPSGGRAGRGRGNGP